MDHNLKVGAPDYRLQSPFRHQTNLLGSTISYTWGRNEMTGNGPRNEKERKVARNSQIGCGVVVLGLIVAIATCDAPPTPSPTGTSAQTALTDAEVSARIAADAISTYTEADRTTYPKLFSKLGNRVFEVGDFGRRAAALAVRTGKCDRVLYVDVSERSTAEELKFFVDCDNETRVRVTETEIERGEVVDVETKEQRQSRVAANNVRNERLISEAKSKVRNSLRDPSSADFGNVFVSEKDGLVTCGLVNARNGFGGPSGEQPFIVFSNRIAMATDSDFKGLWERHCFAL